MGNLNCSNSMENNQLDNYSILLSMSSVGAAAIVVCLVALIMALKFRLHKFFIHRLAIYQVFSALLYSIVCIMEVIFIKHDNCIFCIIEGFMLEYTLWIKLMFTFCLTFHLFCLSVRHVKFARLEVFYVLSSVFGPLLFIWIPFVSISYHGKPSGIIYGRAGAWCWIQNWQNNTASQNLDSGETEQYVLLYGPAISGLILCGVAVLVIAVVLICRAYNCKYCRRNNNDESQPLLLNDNDLMKKRKILREVLPLIIYPILSFMFYIPAFTNRLIGSTQKKEKPNEMSFMWSAISLPLVGLLAGASLIVHILILKCSKNDVPPPATTTRFEPPAESELDDELSIQSTNVDVHVGACN